MPLDDKAEKELNELAKRMVATAVPHPQQHYNEVRVTPLELNTSLERFRSYIV